MEFVQINQAIRFNATKEHLHNMECWFSGNLKEKQTRRKCIKRNYTARSMVMDVQYDLRMIYVEIMVISHAELNFSQNSFQFFTYHNWIQIVSS